MDASNCTISTDLPLLLPSYPLLVPENTSFLRYVTALAISALALTLTVQSFAWVVANAWKSKHLFFKSAARHAPPIPGPKGIPYIGNAPEMDPQHPATKLAEWAKDYPEIFETTALGQKLIWITSTAAQKELFVNRAANYSSRPPLPSTPGSATDPQYLPLMAYGPAWKRHRSFAVSAMAAAHNAQYHGHIQTEASWLQHQLLRNPAGFYDTLSLFTARVSARLAYGSPASAAEHMSNALSFISQISISGPATNRFPFLTALPECLVPSKRAVRLRRAREQEHWSALLAETKHAYAVGKAPPSYATLYLDSTTGSRSPFGFESDSEAAAAVGMLCTVAIFTISGLLTSLMLALARHPEWQAAARVELDEVLGSRRVADPADAPRLPVVRAILKECVRWRPTVPLGVPRVVHEDDVYNGFRVPKGAIVHAVEQVISRDAETYPDPETFNPARFLSPTAPTYREPLSQFPTLKGHHAFGAGWRTCPGIGLVEAEGVVVASAILGSFTIGLPIGEDGTEYIPDPAPTTCVIGGPQRFSVSVRPRLDVVGVERVRGVEV